jgi:hypothetical protein
MPLASSAASRWQAIIDEFRRSGLTQAEFCRQRDLSLQTFRKYLYGSGPVAKTTPVVEFLPVTTPSNTPKAPRRDHDPLIVILADNRRVAVAPGFDADTLRRLIETIESLA